MILQISNLFGDSQSQKSAVVTTSNTSLGLVLGALRKLHDTQKQQSQYLESDESENRSRDHALQPVYREAQDRRNTRIRNGAACQSKFNELGRANLSMLQGIETADRRATSVEEGGIPTRKVDIAPMFLSPRNPNPTGNHCFETPAPE